ncbi:hypothetical protein KFE25_005505 [Diacronema lutheri]|uniref:Divinyl chlorophyllide a 8-vinyl-reductase, chloroplastic n=1 Tax=Diacronema lutheri TaxID=2081491 RepID=A0A8J6CDJ4_DIALT|nr:hypothetical protein KFE25_005505 [Diacronema lutheri]
MASSRALLAHVAIALCAMGEASPRLARGAQRALTARPMRAEARMQTPPFVPGETCTGERVVVVGATGYIGKAVVKEAVRRGYATTAVVRDATRGATEPKFAGARVVEADVTDLPSLGAPGAPFAPGAVDVVVSCLASRSGTKKDSWAIDYQATLNCVEAARVAGARHFVLLSAYCVRSAELRHPYALQFQYAKKALEEKLVASEGLTHSIVRPTAFFKSVSGQLEIVDSGAPFVYFDLGDGKCATCNPISEPDLAAALIDCVADPAQLNRVWNLGGPDAGLSMVEQGKLIAQILGKEKPKLLGVPIGLFDVIVNALQWAATTFSSEKLEDAAELARIGRYYALEDMLTTAPSERYGKTTLREHYERIAREGQEYDPYTTVFARSKLRQQEEVAK